MPKSVYDIIKQQNGEAFAKGIRNFDSGIFEVENLPRIVRYAGREVYDLLPYLASLKPSKKERKDFSTAEDLFQLAQKAGYRVIYADTLEKQNLIQNLFLPNEELCTFKDSYRFKNYHIFHLIKEGAEKLNRADFYGKEEREDEYGTSVLSIQISKQGGFIKICNRYNHTVENPDNTFYSNPDAIIDGMTLAIEKFIGQHIETGGVDVPNGYLNFDGCLYKYHLESDNIFFGTDFYIKDNHVHFINKDYQMIVDCFLVDLKENKIKPLHDMSGDGRKVVYFHSTFNHVALILKEMEQGGRLTRRKENDSDVVLLDGRAILKSKQGVMTYLHLTKPFEYKGNLFCYHDSIEEVYLDNLEKMDSVELFASFFSCSNLKVLSLPKLKEVSSGSISHLPMLRELDLKNVEKVGRGCLNYLGRVISLELPRLKELDSFSLSHNKFMQSIILKNLKELKKESITYHPLLTRVELSSDMQEIHETALQHNPFLVQKKALFKINKNQIPNLSRSNKGRQYE
ncbi:MAG: hypothetical protein IJY92_01800 [Alphaproteobacteria bacterium]|nr:hypothetical protein [Alphaproteobacteria bacterium]